MKLDQYNYCLISLGELYLKGKNQKLFANKLFSNINFHLKSFSLKLKKRKNAFYINLPNDFKQFEELTKQLSLIPGIEQFIYGWAIKPEWDELVTKASQIIEAWNSPYYICCTRKNKNFPKNSWDIKFDLADAIFTKTKIKGQINNNAKELFIRIYQDIILLFSKIHLGPGGLPTGTSGKALLMLSGGIDSPVAAFELLKRGMEVDFIHFTTPPHTKPESINKVVEIVKEFNKITDKPQNLYIVDFSKLQHEIMCSGSESYRIVIMRRMFYRIASRLAYDNKIKALATGESLGQVASQTIENLVTTEDAIKTFVLRPLISQNKRETIKIAKHIGTYFISIQQYSDCCSLFVPKNPVIKSIPKIAQEIEEKMLYPEIIDEIFKHNIIKQII